MKKIHWALALAEEMLCMVAASFLLPFLAIKTEVGIVYGVVLWGVLPLAGACFAYRAVRRSLNNYAAVLPVPVMFTLGHFLAAFYLPNAGSMLLCALLSVIGSAAGHEREMRQ